MYYSDTVMLIYGQELILKIWKSFVISNFMTIRRTHLIYVSLFCTRWLLQTSKTMENSSQSSVMSFHVRWHTTGYRQEWTVEHVCSTNFEWGASVLQRPSPTFHL